MEGTTHEIPPGWEPAESYSVRPAGYNPAVVITGRIRKFRYVPRWARCRIAARTGERVKQLASDNPGFNRFIIEARPFPPTDTGWLVNPDIEPEVRRILSRTMKLDDPVVDEEPWPRL